MKLLKFLNLVSVEGHIIGNIAVLSVEYPRGLQIFLNPSTFLDEFIENLSSAQCGLFIMGRQESARTLKARSV